MQFWRLGPVVWASHTLCLECCMSWSFIYQDFDIQFDFKCRLVTSTFFEYYWFSICIVFNTSWEGKKAETSCQVFLQLILKLQYLIFTIKSLLIYRSVELLICAVIKCKRTFAFKVLILQFSNNFRKCFTVCLHCTGIFKRSRGLSVNLTRSNQLIMLVGYRSAFS